MCLEVTLGGGETSMGLAQVQSKHSNLTMQLQDMVKTKVVHEHVWCTTCQSKGHHMNELCPTLGNYLATGAPNPYSTGPQTKWCEI
jgi:hypothetical protein